MKKLLLSKRERREAVLDVLLMHYKDIQGVVDFYPNDRWKRIAEQTVIMLDAIYEQGTNMTCKDALKLLLDQVDFTKGACSLTDMVGACIPPEVFKICYKAIEEEENK